MSDFSVMRTLLLLNTTRRKLQAEESILDSSSPLKAIQLQKVAQRLNDHLYNEQAVQVRVPLQRSPSQQGHTTVIAETIDEIDEDAAEDVEDEAVSLVEEVPTELEFETVELLDADAESFDSVHPESILSHPEDFEELKIEEIQDENVDVDVAELDITAICREDDDELALSRQDSPTSMPSLYHSDNSDSDDDEAHLHNVDALSRFSSTFASFHLHTYSSSDFAHKLPAQQPIVARFGIQV